MVEQVNTHAQKMLRGTPKTGIAAICLTAMMLIAPTSAAASDSENRSESSSIVVRDNDTDSGITPYASVPLRDGTHRMSAAGQSFGGVFAQFATDVQIDNLGTYARILNGGTTTAWKGSGTGSVTIRDYIWATGLNVTVSAPSGVSGSIGSNGYTYVSTSSGTNRATSAYSGLSFSGALFTINQDTTASWKVNGANYHYTVN